MEHWKTNRRRGQERSEPTNPTQASVAKKAHITPSLL